MQSSSSFGLLAIEEHDGKMYAVITKGLRAIDDIAIDYIDSCLKHAHGSRAGRVLRLSILLCWVALCYLGFGRKNVTEDNIGQERHLDMQHVFRSSHRQLCEIGLSQRLWQPLTMMKKEVSNCLPPTVGATTTMPRSPPLPMIPGTARLPQPDGKCPTHHLHWSSDQDQPLLSGSTPKVLVHVHLAQSLPENIKRTAVGTTTTTPRVKIHLGQNVRTFWKH